jgi:polyhydroxybutyrate depolymerase
MFRSAIRATALACLAALSIGTPALACGGTEACKLGDRRYYIQMPPDHDGKTAVPALVFLHGYQGSGLGSLRWKALRAAAADLGAALIVPEGVDGSWMLDNTPGDPSGDQSDELAYFDAMKTDATRRFAVDPDRMVVVGASAGGMAAWTLACHRSASFAGFVPMAGTFWAPVPPTCNGPVASVVHIHGDADTTVPLEGRAIGPAHQGSVPQTLAMYRAYGRFGAASQDAFGDLSCEMRANAEGAVLDFCQFSGGHSFSPRHMIVAWKILETAGRL